MKRSRCGLGENKTIAMRTILDQVRALPYPATLEADATCTLLPPRAITFQKKTFDTARMDCNRLGGE